MEGPLTPTAWLMLLGMAIAGAWMFFFVKPYDCIDPKTNRVDFIKVGRLFGMVFISSVAGAGVTPGICEYLTWTNIYQEMLVSFLAALLVLPFCRGAVAVVESEVVKWIKERIFGKSAGSAEEGRDGDRTDVD